MNVDTASHLRPTGRAAAPTGVHRLALRRAMTRFGRPGTMRRLAVIIAVIAVGALLVGGTGPVITGSTAPQVTGATAVRGAGHCRGGTEVSAFVCRNTWMTWTRHAPR